MIIDQKKIEETLNFLYSRTAIRPEYGIILGSGLGDVVKLLQDAVLIPYTEIPHFPVSSVKGHPGKLALGTYAGKSIIIQVGRVHFYEGLGAEKVMYPLWVMKKMGVRTIINTNSAGGINPDFTAGDLMMVTDHINFMFQNPLIGPNDEKIGPRFPDMSRPYDRDLQRIALKASKSLGIQLGKGVLVAFLGPSYETKAEIALADKMGADAVGMSTVPECIIANYLGVHFLALTCIANLVGPSREEPLSHDEVTKAAASACHKLRLLIAEILKKI